MKKIALAATALIFSASAAFAAPHTYQVTGPVVAVDKDKIIVQKDADKWEIALDKNTKAPKDIKAGDRVTVEYSMTAAKITNKDAKADDKAAAKPAKTDKVDKKAKK